MKRVLLIHTDGNTFNNPTLKSVVDLLLEHDVHLTIRYPLNLSKMPEISGVLLLPFGKVYRKAKDIVFNCLCWEWMSLLSVWIEEKLIYEKYDLVIGVDRQGLIEAGLLYRLKKTPFVFFSFEIMFESETSKKFKALERKAAAFTKSWFVQDEIRALHIQNENKLNPNTKTLLPLASSGLPRVSRKRLRDELGIRFDKKVAIAMGSMSDWSMIAEIISSVSSWPDEWVLVLHDRYGRTETELSMLGFDINEMTNGRIFISNHASVLIDEMSEILAGVSAGLAFYKPDFNSPYTGNNLKYLGLASGKISTYLRHGVPPVMNDIGIYSDLATEYRFGLVAETAQEIGLLLPSLTDTSWSVRAINFYEQHLDFANYKDLVWEKLCDAEEVN